jgi:hypothetical protein
MNDTDLNQIANLLDQKLEPIKKELNKHGRMLKSLKKDQDTMLKMLDREQMDQSKRLKRVESHLDLTPLAS